MILKSVQITVRLCRSSSRCFRYVIIHTVIPCNLQKSRIGITPRYYSICEISRDRSIRRVNNTNLKGRRNDAYVGSALCLRHQEENALHLVQFIESTDCVGGFASLSLSFSPYVNAQIRSRESRSSVASRSDTLITDRMKQQRGRDLWCVF